MFDKAEKILNQDFGPYLIDEVSNAIISEFDTDVLIARRRGNFVFLHDALKNLKDIEPVFKNVSNATCPFFFPVYVHAGRNKLKELLISEDIYCQYIGLSTTSNINSYPLSKDIYRTFYRYLAIRDITLKTCRESEMFYQYYLT